MSKELSKDFLHELFKICLKKPEVLVLARDYLKYQYLPGEEYKLVWQAILNYYELNNSCISVGILSQKFQMQEKVQTVLSKIKSADLINQDEAVEQLREFIRLNLFIDSYDKIGELYQKGEKNQAIELLKSAYEELDNFSIKKAVGHTEVFASLVDRLLKRREEAKEKENVKVQRKLPTGITPLDVQIGGGVDRGDTACFMAGSGIGKSKLLKWVGISLSRRGFRVLHIQLEGSETEALDAYDAGITGSTISDLESGIFSDKTVESIKKGCSYISNLGGEIFVKGYSQFNSATMLEIRSLVVELGSIDALILDYIELADPGNGKRYDTSNEGERARRTAVSNEFKNIAVEFNLAGFTATQSTTVDNKDSDDPEFVLTRYHISEFKGLLKPFSYFVTLNQTRDEYEEGIIRLYGDKTRKYKLLKRVIPIFTLYSRERFYDHIRSVKAFGYE